MTSLSWRTSFALYGCCAVCLFPRLNFFYVGKENGLPNTEQTPRRIREALAPASMESVDFVEKFCLCCLWFQAHQVDA